MTDWSAEEDERRFALMASLMALDEFASDCPDVAAAKAYADAVIDYANYSATVDVNRLLAEADPELREFVLRTTRFLRQTTEAVGLGFP